MIIKTMQYVIRQILFLWNRCRSPRIIYRHKLKHTFRDFFTPPDTPTTNPSLYKNIH